MPSGAGLNRVHKTVTLSASGDSGPLCQEARYFANWLVMVTKVNGTVTGPSVTVYGTTDPNTAGVNGAVATATNWSVLDAPSSVGAVIVNPITVVDGTQHMIHKSPILAIRLLANAFTGGGSVQFDITVSP